MKKLTLKQIVNEIVKKQILNEITRKDLIYPDSRKEATKWMLQKASDKEALRSFLKAYWAGGQGYGRWTPTAKNLFKVAFPNARFAYDLGLDLGKSGTVAKTTDGSLILFKHSIGIKSKSTGYMYNRSQGYIID